jgi:hypothetical protein
MHSQKYPNKRTEVTNDSKLKRWYVNTPKLSDANT